MSNSGNPLDRKADRLLHRMTGWKLLRMSGLVLFLVLCGVVLFPWDIKPVEAPDLELKIPEIDPADNAFTWFEKAARVQGASIPGQTQQRTGLFCGIVRSDKWDSASAAKVLVANAAVFPDLEKGLACQQCILPQSDSVEMRLAGLQKCKSLAELLRLKSTQALQAGDYAGSAAAAFQAFRLGELVAGGSSVLMEWVAGMELQCLAVECLKNLAADARTPDPVLEEIKASLGKWNPDKVVEGYKNAIRGEYTYGDRKPFRGEYTFIGSLMARVHRQKSHGWKSALAGIPYYFKPNMMRRKMIEIYRSQIQVAGLPRSQARTVNSAQSLPSGSTMIGRLAYRFGMNRVGETICYWGTVKIRMISSQESQLESNISVLRMKIALRQYEKQHGQWPDSLQALVPEFTDKIPIDPMEASPAFDYVKNYKQIRPLFLPMRDTYSCLRSQGETTGNPWSSLWFKE